MTRTAPPPIPAERRGNLARRHPLAAFLLLAFTIGVPGLVIPLLAGIPVAPFLLLLVFVALLGSSLLVTWKADGPAGVRKLLSRVVQWRFSGWAWGVILFSRPRLYVGGGALSRPLGRPERGGGVAVGWGRFHPPGFRGPPPQHLAG